MSYTNNHNKRFKREASPNNMYQNNMNSYNQDNDLYHKAPRNHQGNPVNRILLYTIVNQRYVITLEAIHKISSRFGNVVRIVMIRKKGTQAMVEFENCEDAKKAMEGLQNQDIYSGCCTLKVDYARAGKLNVRKNDTNSWDFIEQPTLTVDASKQPLIGGGPDGNSYDQGYGGPGGSSYGSRGGYNQGGYGGGPGSHHSGGYGGGYGGPGGPQGGYGSSYGQSMGPGGHMNPNRTPVAIVYGLVEDKINCTHLFNILCLYGNVAKIKFMKSKPGCAMVEFTDTDAVTKATKLTGAELYGSKLTVRPSKSMFVGEPKGESFVLPDKSPGFEDFNNSKFNRFQTHEKASKNRAQEPRSTVHFFNAPVDATEEDIKAAVDEFKDEDGNSLTITKFVMFPQKEKSKSSAGLITFENINQSMICLAEVNHKSMDSKASAYPYNVKFCFATQDLKDQ